MANLGRSGSSGGSYYERENSAQGRSMEPGSTFKLATMLTLRDDAGMSPETTYDTHNGDPVTVGPARNIRDSHRGDHVIGFRRAVASSSNVYFAKAIWDRYGITGKKQEYSDLLHEKLHLGKTVGLERLGERAPSITADWKVPDPGVMLVKMSYGDRVRLEFDIPSRGIIGLRSNMLTATAGEAIMTHRLKDFEPWVGEIEMRTNGSIISGETGTAFAYSIDKLQDRGRFFISPMDQVYEGQVIGEHTRQNDITVNVTTAKQLTNMRASGSDDKTSIAPPKVFTLEEALEYIQADEYVEVTPHAMRLRKILLHEVDRKRASK